MSTTTPTVLDAAISGPSAAERERDAANEVIADLQEQIDVLGERFLLQRAILTAYIDRAELHWPWKTVAPEDVAIYRRACEAAGRVPKC